MRFVQYRTGHFNWRCANVLSGLGDSFSSAGATAFELAAVENKIDVCTKATYEAGSMDMKAPIKRIMDNNCCRVTVLFGQTQDMSSLLLEAHRQKYPGEWIMSENVMATLDGVVNNLKNHLDEPTIHKLLRGIVYIRLDGKLHLSRLHLFFMSRLDTSS